MRGVLELRLDQIAQPGVDGELLSYVKTAVRDMLHTPDLALKWVPSMASRALAVIWAAELGQDQKLPEAWIREWKDQWRDDRRLPTQQGKQCKALRLATGGNDIRPLAKFVTKPTALLVDALQSVGDFGQHREDFRETAVTVGYAAGVVMTAIELVDSLSRDLAREARAC